jgi:ATP phosphoribosyltransferase regulatory subunit
VRDFLPRAAARRRHLAERVIELFESWGYARIITPMFEVADVLERGLGADARAAAIRFVEPGTGEVVALRPDITPQVARLAATRMRDAAGPLRFCYEGEVTRLAPAGGQREILQAGIELIDAAAPAGDAEVLAVAAAALAETSTDARLDIGHVAFARHVLDGVPSALAAPLRAALSRKDRAGVAALVRDLPRDIATLASALASLWGPAAATLDAARALPWPPTAVAALDQIAAVIDGDLGGAAVAVSVDLGELRGFDYYTGLRFGGFVAGAADAVLRGGRYDDLMARYGRPAPATGFAIDIEAIAEATVDPIADARGVLVVGDPVASRVLAAALRAGGVRAAVDLVPREVAALPAYLVGAGLDAAVVLDGAAGARVITAGGTTRTISDVATATVIAAIE